MLGYIGTFVLGVVGYAVFSAFFPEVAAKITEIQGKITVWVKAKFNKDKVVDLEDEIKPEE